MSLTERFNIRSCLVLNCAAVLILALFVEFATRSTNWSYSIALKFGQHKSGRVYVVVSSRVSCAVDSGDRLYECAAICEIAASLLYRW